jgi:hypothetical protein
MFSTEGPPGHPPQEKAQTLVSPTAAAIIAATEKDDAPGAPVRVKVIEPYRVCHKGEVFVGGQTASVPAATAQTWIKSGWAEPITPNGKKK